jgi:hypothetical protein
MRCLAALDDKPRPLLHFRIEAAFLFAEADSMKSQDRLRLETNWMAEHLTVWIEKLRPYATSIAGIALTVFIAMFAWSYLSGSSSAWQSKAWDAYNEAVASPIPDLELLRESAEEHPGTKMQELADITWADGQVWLASENYLISRAGSRESLNRAAGAYQSILQSASDERMLNRARLGLARVYELQDELDKAREQYAKVTGSYTDFAKARAKTLGDEKTKEICSWLASAELPRPMAPAGPGTPGRRPPFSVSDFPLPGEAKADETSSGDAGAKSSLDELLEGLNLGDLESPSVDTPGRYEAGETAPADVQPAGEAPAADQPAAEQPAVELPASESPSSDNAAGPEAGTDKATE